MARKKSTETGQCTKNPGPCGPANVGIMFVRKQQINRYIYIYIHIAKKKYIYIIYIYIFIIHNNYYNNLKIVGINNNNNIITIVPLNPLEVILNMSAVYPPWSTRLAPKSPDKM